MSRAWAPSSSARTECVTPPGIIHPSPRSHDAGLVADGELHGPFQANAALLVWVAVEWYHAACL